MNAILTVVELPFIAVSVGCEKNVGRCTHILSIFAGEGYELVGKSEKYCQADGAWSPKELPTCVCK